MNQAKDNILLPADPAANEWLQYRELEYILSGIFKTPGREGLSKLRARYKNFQRLGLPLHRKPGKGSKSLFSVQEVCEVLLAFQLAEYDISPLVITELISIFARNKAEIYSSNYDFRGVLDAIAYELLLVFSGVGLSRDIYLVFEANFLSSRWLTPIVSDLKFCLSDNSQLHEVLLNSTGAKCLINLTDLARRSRQYLNVNP